MNRTMRFGIQTGDMLKNGQTKAKFNQGSSSCYPAKSKCTGNTRLMVVPALEVWTSI